MFLNLMEIALSTFRYKLFKHRTPLVLSMSVTSRCNLKCVYCYSAEDNLKAKDVPLEDVTSIIDEFYKLGTRVIMLQGGEPLVHKNIVDIVNHVKSKQMYCAVTTNSVNFERYLDALIKVDQVQLSIDGNREITDGYRGKGVYESVVSAARLCHENKIPFHLHTVVTNTTTEENTLKPLKEFANKYRTYLNFCMPVPTGSARDKHLADNKQIIEFYKLIKKGKKDGMPTNNSYHGIDSVIKWCEKYSYNDFISSEDKEELAKYPKCIMGNLVCWLDSAGMLHPCAVHFGQKDFSYSIKEFGAKGAWEKLKNVPCHYCGCSSEFNNLFNLKMEPIINALKFVLKRK